MDKDDIVKLDDALEGLQAYIANMVTVWGEESIYGFLDEFLESKEDDY